DLADENVARLHFRTDVRNTGFIELRKRGLADIRDVRGDFLGSQLRVARNRGQLFDVNRREAIFLDDTLGDEDGVLEVVAVPGHERDEQVLAKRKFADVRRRTVSQHIAARNDVALLHQRTLVDAGVLVGARVL